MNDIRNNIEQIEKRISEACNRAGRSRSRVKLIAVSKTKPIDSITAAIECGILDFGENRPQELCEKTKLVSPNVHWHLIGHLQTNKVKLVVGSACLIHSVDSIKLAREIDQEARKRGTFTDVLCEVNVSGEQSKSGFAAGEALNTINEIISDCKSLRVKGLMTVAPKTDIPHNNRAYFKKLRLLMDKINSSLPNDKRLSELSMGMSGDFEVAIEEGATMVRVGTGIFGTRDIIV